MGGPLDDLRDRLLGRDGRQWAGSVDDLLFDGESVRRTVALGDNRVVVTSHRLLALTPDGDGENYRRADLPNVADVRPGHDGEDDLLVHAVRLFLYGGVLLAVGLFVDFESFVPTDAFAGTGTGASRLGLGGLMATMQRLLALLASLDDVARAVGALLLLFGAVVVLGYLLTRERVLVVSVAGDDPDILVPAGEAEGDADGETDPVDDAVAALETELFEPGHGGVDEAADAGTADTGFKSDDPL